MGEGPPQVKGEAGSGGWGGSQPVKGALAVGSYLWAALGGGDGLTPDKEKPESEGLSWRNL